MAGYLFIYLFFVEFTSKDGLVHTQGGGLDGNKPDVSGDFVTNCGDHRKKNFTKLIFFLADMKPL